MRYYEALEFIHSIARFGSKPGLRRVKLLLERMGNPQNDLRFIHVAGTNGKGSVCTMLSHILKAAGLRTGLYISPFVLDFRERIQLDNQMISEEDLAHSTALVKFHWDDLDAIGETPTEFEVVVAVAMDYFRRQNCDIVVLEVGMGGRFDATNIIDRPLCSVITSIGIDHVEYLGDTLGQIAFEKCGIIKEGGATVCYPRQPDEAMAVIREQCIQKHNRLLVGGQAEVLGMSIAGSDIRYGEQGLHIPLAGEHQVYNAVTVLEAVNALELAGLAISRDAVQSGIAGTFFPARMEILGRDPLILLDGAHNLLGAQALAQGLTLLEPDQAIHAVIGILADKDVQGVLGAVLPRCASVTAVRVPSPRAMDAQALAEMAAAFCPQVLAAPGLEEGAAQALARCGKSDVLLLFGSLYLAADLRPIALKLAREN